MTNFFKILIYNLYIVYKDYFPINKGKYKLGVFIFNILGHVKTKVQDFYMLLNPISLIDGLLFREKTHDDDVANIIVDKLKDGGTFVDIGANIGYFTLIASNLSKTKVLAFEPSSRELEILLKNISINKLTNVIVFPFGLSSEYQELKLNVFSLGNPGMNSIINYDDNLPKQDIICYPFDSILGNSSLTKDVKLVKIDVEGYELPVLKGMSQFLFQNKSIFYIIEITYNKPSNISEPDLIYEYMENKGFNCKYGKAYSIQYNEVFFQ